MRWHCFYFSAAVCPSGKQCSSRTLFALPLNFCQILKKSVSMAT